jgi:hypothetical protein
MAVATFTVACSVVFTPPGANVNSGQSSFPSQGTYGAQCSGNIDVPSGTVLGTSYSIPFGSVAAAKLLIVKNMMSSDIAVRLNGAVTDTFRIAAGGEFMYASPATPSGTPLASALFMTTASPTADEQVLFVTLGD